MAHAAAGWRVELATEPSRILAAVELLVQRVDPAQRELSRLTWLQQLADTRTTPRLWCVVEGERLLAAQLCVLRGDGTGLLLLPEVADAFAVPQPDRQAHLLHCLADAVLGDCDAHGMKVVQCLVDESEAPRLEYLTEHGFAPELIVSHFTRPITTNETVPAPVRPTKRAAWRPFSSSDVPLFESVLEATFAGSLDCPVLTHVRTGADLLTAFRLHDRHDPAAWELLLASNSNPNEAAVTPDAVRGVLLLTPGTISQPTEINYIGVIPAHRGKGWGDELMARAVTQATACDSPRLEVLVDHHNHPAVRLYKRWAFESTQNLAVRLRLNSRFAPRGQD